MKIYAYLRVSTLDQNNDKFLLDLYKYADQREFGNFRTLEEKISGTQDWRKRELGNLLINIAEEGDHILIPELSRISRSIIGIYEVIEFAQKKGIILHIIKQQLVIEKELSMTTKVILSTFSMIAELERDFISTRTKEALQAKKEAGVKLGRPVGSKSSKLDKHKDEILGLIQLGVTKKKIAEKYEITPQGLYRWLNNNQ